MAASDVTERKAAEKALRRSEHELRVHQTELELQNEERRSARVQLEASNRALSRFIFKDDQHAYFLLINNLSMASRPHACELRMTRLDSAPFWARLETAACFDEGGMPGWRVVISDITERKQAEESLRHSEENLRRLLDQVREMNVGLEGRFEERTRPPGSPGAHRRGRRPQG